MLKGIVRSNNLFDKDTATTYKQIDSSTGESVNSYSTRTASDYIEIPNGVIAISGSNNGIESGAFYNENKTYISGFTSYSNIPVPNNSKYLRLTVNTDILGSFMLNTGSQVLPYEPYGGIQKDITRIAMKGKNLFDKSTITTGHYANTSGTAANNSYYCSDFIPITAATYYFQNAVGSSYQNTVVVYDANKQGLRYVRLTGGAKVSGALTFQTGDAYIRINCYYQTDVDTVMVSIGNVALPYEPYGMQSGWEVRDQQGRIIWGADKTLTGTDSITYKGYGLDIKEYEIDGSMVQAAEKAYSISGTSPLDFQSNGSNATISISGNETQASNQAYTTSGTSPLSFNADGTNLTALSMDGNMNQASSQPYTVSGTSPISFMNNGTAIDYTVSGNMNQSGTPTPTSPITPQECGERTGNLWNYTIEQGGWSAAAGTIPAKTLPDNPTYPIRCRAAYIMPIPSNTMSFTCQSGIKINFVWINANGVSLGGSGWQQSGSTVTAPENAASVTFILAKVDDSTCSPNDFQNIMLNLGSTALPYEPYGYKIPVTNGSTTYNIYLSEPLRKIGDYSDTVNSDGSVTRVIKKLVLDGTETGWTCEKINDMYRAILTLPAIGAQGNVVACYSTHYVYNYGFVNDTVYVGATGPDKLYINDVTHAYYSDSGNRLVNWLPYLAAQYQAGTPVTIWYVLSTAQTDTATVPTITPTTGNNTLSVDTTLAPSNITITSNSSVFPGNPITPIECGVKTENLWANRGFSAKPIGSNYTHNISNDYGTTLSTTKGNEVTITQSAYPTGNVGYQNGFFMIDVDFSKYAIGSVVTMSFDYIVNEIHAMNTQTSTSVYAGSDSNAVSNTLSSGDWKISGRLTTKITVKSGMLPYVEVRLCGNSITVKNIMLNSGSTALPYEPYGYKIPITCGGNTYNIFTKAPLRKIGNYSDSIGSDGVVTRNIKKVVLDGTEDWTPNARNDSLQIFQAYTNINDGTLTASNVVCSHLETVDSPALTYSNQAISMRSSSTGFIVGISYGVIGTVAGESGSAMATKLKAYTAAQYTAGTPITIWYVLGTQDTTETTTIPTISTVNGANTLTTQTPITPSNITISTSSSVYPKNPIYPEECGDKTANLFDKDNATVYDCYITTNGQWAIGTGNKTVRIPCDSNIQYTLSTASTYSAFRIMETNSDNIPSDGSPVSGTLIYYGSGNTYTFTTSNTAKYIIFQANSASISQWLSELMLNLGSTALPYEPYGYKIPITCAGQTQTVYISEPLRKIRDYSDSVSSDGTVTRRIYKFVLTGEEYWSSAVFSGHNGFLAYAPNTQRGTINCVCSHYKVAYENTNNTLYFIQNPANGRFIIFDDRFSSTTDFKAFLASEYSAGHPVEVWYVLATPVSDTATFPTVTPASGSNTLSVNTTLAPSSITLTTTSGVWTNNPIEPEEFGDRTMNLAYGRIEGVNIGTNGQIYPFTDYDVAVARVEKDVEYTANSYVLAFYTDEPLSGSISYNESRIVATEGTPTTFTAPITGYVAFRISSGQPAMLSTGTTALPYEPYGKYKITITNSGQTYNVYLTEPLRKIGDYADVVNSDGTVTRAIKKLVLDGTEASWALATTNLFTLSQQAMPITDDKSALCTHFAGVGSRSGYSQLYADQICVRSTGTQIWIRCSNISTLSDFTTFLATQYANGTPVIVWYALATPTTETIITPTIETTVGTNILTVDTTLVPSNTTITGHIKPIHFGFKIDKTNSNSDTAVTYTHDAVTMTPAAMNFTTNEFNYGSWENVWFVKDAYPVALNLDGTEAYKLNPNDYTKKDDGTDSDIQFVLLTEAPSDWSTQWKQYYTKDANDNYELNSQSSAPTFTTNTYYKLTYNSLFTGNFMMAFPKVYFRRAEDATYNYVEVSDKKLGDDWYAYAHINTNGQEVDFIYLPLFKGVIVNSKLRSIPGVIPQGNTTATDEVNAATALGSRWHIWDHSSVELINDLLTLMSKSIDSQGRYGQGRSSGYDSTDTVTYGKLQTGTLVKKGKFCGYSVTTKEVKVFGLEGFWANRLDRLQGMMLMNNVWKIKMTPPYNFTGTDFVTLSTAEVPSGTGFLSRVQTSEYGSIPASIANGSSTKYFKDPFFKSATNTRVALRGGSCTDGGNAGFRYINVDSAASISYWAVGASPVYK